MGDIIPIVFASNDRYAPYLGVALQSLIRYASEENKYRIYILTTEMSVNHQRKLQQMEREHVSIIFCDVTEYMKHRKIGTVNHLSVETTYRLLIGELFPEYEKVLYLDSDIIVLKDVAELYQENINGYMLGASLGRLFRTSARYIRTKLLMDPAVYFNAGVLLINVKLFLELKIGTKALNMLSRKNYLTQDQDVLNILCKDRVKYIDGHWNVEWEHLIGSDRIPVIDKAREGTLEYVENPYIVHYTSPVKPWAHPEIWLADFFWREARVSPFYEEILFQNSVRKEIQKQYLFPWECMERYTKIILYGYGKVGHAFYEQIKRTLYCDIIAICDKNVKKADEISLPIIQISEISSYKYDYIVVAIEDKKVARNIKKELITAGISKDKIIWKNPLR